MNQHRQAASSSILVGNKLHAINWEGAVVVYARIALGAAFLSAVAARFGLWHGTFDLMYFAKFLQYTAEVNSFMPSAIIPLLAWTATVAEITFGLLLILGLWPRWVSLGSAVLLVMFGTAMAISFGLKSPMDYSVFSASGAALLLALHPFSKNGRQSGLLVSEGLDRIEPQPGVGGRCGGEHTGDGDEQRSANHDDRIARPDLEEQSGNDGAHGKRADTTGGNADGERHRALA